MTLIQKSPLRSKWVKYSWVEILEVIVEEMYKSEGMTYYSLILKLASRGGSLSVSCQDFSGRTEVEEMATLIQNFLEI